MKPTHSDCICSFSTVNIILMPKSSKRHLLFRFFISNFISICHLTCVYCTSQPSWNRHDFGLLLWCKWYCCSSGILCSVEWQLVTDFWDILLVPTSRVRKSKKMPVTLQYAATKGMVWVVTSYRSALCEMPEEWRSHLAILHLISDIFVNCNLVDTQWQYYSTHLHTNSTQNNSMKQNIQNKTYIIIRIYKHNNKNI